MAKDLLIRLEARDNASAVFTRTGRAGREMGEEIDRGAEQAADALDELDQAQDDVGQSAVDMVLDVGRASDALGRDLPQGAERGGRALDELDRAQDEVGRGAVEMSRDVQASGRSLRDLGDAGQQVGAGLALLGTSFAMYANQVRANEVATASLGRTYGDAAGQFVALADQIQSTTIFSNDEAVQAAAIFGTLKRNYELTNNQIQQLIVTSADLAAVNGVTLTDSATRVAAAIRGEGESAEALGLTMNQSAIDAENLTLTMSNAEAGQFRFNALMDQTAFSVGAAAEAAEEGAGKWQRYGNEVEDVVQEFVAFTGPVGDAAAGLSTMGLEAGLALSGLVQLGRGIRTASVAMGGMSALLGPAALVGALGLGVVAAIKLSDAMRSDLSRSLEETSRQAETLEQTVNALAASMGDAALAIDIKEGYEDIERMNVAFHELDATLKDLRYPQGLPAGAPQGEIDAYNQYIATQQEAQAQAAALTQEYGSLEAALAAVDDAQDAYKTILENTQPGAEAAIQTAINLFNAYENGEMTFTQLRDALNGVVADLPNYATQALEAQAATDAAAQAAADYQAELAGLRTEINQTTVAIGEYLAAQNPGQAAGALFIENAKQIEEVLRIIETAMADGVANSPYDLFGGQAAFDQLQSDLMAIQTSTEAGSNVVRIWADQLTEAFLAGRLTTDEYANGIRELSERSDEFAAQAAIMAWEMEHNSVTAQQFAEAIGLSADAVDRLGKAHDGAIVRLERSIQLTTEDTGARIRNADAARIQADAIYEMAAALQEERELTFRVNFESDPTGGRPVARPQADALYDAAVAAEVFNARGEQTQAVIAEIGTLVNANVLPWQAYQQALADVSDEFGILSTNAKLFQAAGIDAPSLDVAVNLQMGGDDLGRIFNTIVGQTNQMSQQLGQVESWADKLIGDPGTWSQLDQLLADGRISLEQYTAAQEAQVRISTDVENAQQDLLAVQANLAPVIADATRRQAEYIDGLQNLGPEAQLAALGFMDQAESARALEIAQLAATSSTKGQQQATTTMIEEMVRADPVLGAMLEKMGIISYGAKGEIIVDFSGAEDANSAIDGLNQSIEELTTLLEEIFNVDTTTNAPSTTLLVEALTGAIHEIPDKVTTYINAVDNVSAAVREAAFALDGINGKTVDTYINTHYSTTGTKAPGLATGGTIPFEARPVVRDLPAFAGGGTLALVGDGGGPELVRLPTGAQVYSAPATRSMLATAGRNGGEGAVIINGPVTLQPAGSDAYGAIRRAALSRARGY